MFLSLILLSETINIITFSLSRAPVSYFIKTSLTAKHPMFKVTFTDLALEIYIF